MLQANDVRLGQIVFALDFCSLVVEILLYSLSCDYLIKMDTPEVSATHALECKKH